MKKTACLLALCCFLLTACLDTTTTTQINADESGTIQSTMDLSNMLGLLSSKSNREEPVINLDTVVYMKYYSDTSTALTAKQKELMKNMKVGMKVYINAKERDRFQFVISIFNSFRNQDELTALSAFMSQKEYDKLFDQAIAAPFSKLGMDDKSPSEDDNLFGAIFPDYYQCIYKKGFIGCTLDKAKHAQALQHLKEIEFDPDGEMESKMFEAATFSNKITLPAKPRNITGGSISNGTKENELIQTGNLLDLYKNPEKFEYTVQY